MGKARIIPADPKATFLPFQSRWINDRSRLKLGEKSRQIGWSWTAAYACVRRTSVQGARYDQWVTSRDELQAKLFLQDCKLFSDVISIAAKDLGEQIVDETTKATAGVLQFPNKRCIYSMSSNPDAQAGKRGGRVLDEFALHKDPRLLWSIAYPGITWGGSLEVFSTHRGSKNFFNQLIREVKEGGNPKRISLHTVTLQTALEEGLLYKLQQKLAPDDPIQDMDEAEYFDYVKSGCADEESFNQEYQCQPADDDTAFLEYDLIASCEYDRDVAWQSLEGRELYCGVDIGRKKDLTVLWVLERLGDVLYTRAVITMERMRKSAQEDILYPWFSRCRRICIDATGMGIGWADDAQDKYGEHRVEAVNFSGPVKEALAYPVRGAMEDRRVRIPYDIHVRADLRSVTKVTTPAGNIRFTAERTEDGHADRFWALALAIHAASTPSAPIEFQSAGRRVTAADGPGRFSDTGFGTVPGSNDFGGFVE